MCIDWYVCVCVHRARARACGVCGVWCVRKTEREGEGERENTWCLCLCETSTSYLCLLYREAKDCARMHVREIAMAIETDIDLLKFHFQAG